MTATGTPTVFRSPLPAPACGFFWEAICGPTLPSRCRLATARPTTQAAAQDFCFRCRTPSSSVQKERRRAAFRPVGVWRPTVHFRLGGTPGGGSDIALRRAEQGGPVVPDRVRGRCLGLTPRPGLWSRVGTFVHQSNPLGLEVERGP